MERGNFYHLSKEGLGSFSVPFSEGSHFLNGGNQALGGEWEGGMQPRTPLAPALRRHFSLLARVATWPPFPSWRDPLHSWLSLSFIFWPLPELFFLCCCLTFACLN